MTPGLRSAVTPFLIYRGRTRHELGLEGLLGRVATAARFHHAVWGPDELFYGELYASRKVPCKPTLGRPDARDDYSACVGAELVERDLYDFMLFSLPDNDHYSHRHGPGESEVSITHADGCIAELIAPAGGLEPFLERNAVIVMADHAQSDVTDELDLAALLAERWHVLRPNEDKPEGGRARARPELPGGRRLGPPRRRARPQAARGRPRAARRAGGHRPAALARARRRARRPHRGRPAAARPGGDRARRRAAPLRPGCAGGPGGAPRPPRRRLAARGRSRLLGGDAGAEPLDTGAYPDALLAGLGGAALAPSPPT